VFRELAEDCDFYRQVKLTDPYPIGVFGWTPKYVDMSFAAKATEVGNMFWAEWDKFQSEFENDFEYGVVHYFIDRRVRFEN
jgi:hypothetical protein